jgi:serine/threonine-protein kinase
VLALLGSLAILVSAIWHLSRAPSADELYAEIQATMSDGGTVRLIRAEPVLREFLERFGDDPRAAQLTEHRRELDLMQLERRLATAARRSEAPGEWTPVESTYVRALKLANDQPEQALRQFEALIQLYEHPTRDDSSAPRAAPDSQAEIADFVELARRRVAEIHERFSRYAAEHQRLLDERARIAEQMQRVDPSQAQRIWQGMVTLYGDKPWAAPWVERARRALERSDKGLVGEPLPAENESTVSRDE